MHASSFQQLYRSLVYIQAFTSTQEKSGRPGWYGDVIWCGWVSPPTHSHSVCGSGLPRWLTTWSSGWRYVTMPQTASDYITKSTRPFQFFFRTSKHGKPWVWGYAWVFSWKPWPFPYSRVMMRNWISSLVPRPFSFELRRRKGLVHIARACTSFSMAGSCVSIVTLSKVTHIRSYSHHHEQELTIHIY